eukprot:TRINITY_DN24445_c0_g1_i1.p1 TRINITY_DN24445_c0_g1~~TRINITY_DN24445_c0_g1_i1.p1  ORF type:complete len:148 (-),score=18.05 TRINITY_DN24445_c0_g1_i1:132-575(-)
MSWILSALRSSTRTIVASASRATTAATIATATTTNTVHTQACSSVGLAAVGRLTQTATPTLGNTGVISRLQTRTFSYKLKTHAGTKKRFRATGKGLLKHYHAGKRHLNRRQRPYQITAKSRNKYLRPGGQAGSRYYRMYRKLMPTSL